MRAEHKRSVLRSTPLPMPRARRSGAETLPLRDELRAMLDAVEMSQSPEGRTAVGCHVLGKIFPATHSLHTVLHEVLSVLLDSLYLPAEEDDAACAAAFSQHADTTSLISRKSFKTEFESYRQHWGRYEVQAESLGRAIDVRTKVLNSAIGVWQQSTILRIFTAWRNSATKRKAHFQSIRDTLGAYRARELLLRVLSCWRIVAALQSVQRVQTSLHDNLSALEQNKAQVEMLRSELIEKSGELQIQKVGKRETVWHQRSCTTGFKTLCEDYAYRVEGWTDLSQSISDYCLQMRNVDAARFDASDLLDENGPQPCPYLNWHEITSQVLLDWVNKRFKALQIQFPKRQIVPFPVANFSSDWRSGEALMNIVATLHNDNPPRAEELFAEAERIEASLAELKKLGFAVTAQPGDIAQGHQEAVVAILSTLWHNDRADASDGIELEMRDVLSSGALRGSWEGFMLLKSELNEWVKRVLAIDEYTLYLGTCRAQGTHARLYTKQEEKELQKEQLTYFELTPSNLPELYPPESAGEGQGEALQTLLKGLEGYFPFVKKAFAHYSGGGDEKRRGVDSGQFWRFCCECDLIDASFTKAQSAQLFADVLFRSKAPQNTTEDTLLSPPRFLQALIRIAVIKYGAKASGDITKDAHQHKYATKTLFEQNVIPKAGMAIQPSSDFRTAVWSEPVQAVLRRHRAKTAKLFAKYAAEGTEGAGGGGGGGGGGVAGPSSPGVLALDGTVQILTDAGLVPKRITAAEVAELFRSSQSDDDAHTMVLSEFEEFIAALSAYTNPSPFDPLPDKVQAFLDQQLSVLCGGKAPKKGRRA